MYDGATTLVFHVSLLSCVSLPQSMLQGAAKVKEYKRKVLSQRKEEYSRQVLTTNQVGGWVGGRVGGGSTRHVYPLCLVY